jgi:hypothetical protein
MGERLKKIRETSSKRLVKILHINREYKVFYCLIRDGAKIITEVSLAKAIEFLKTSEFDLVLFEPKNMAILTPQQGVEALGFSPS